LSDYLKKLAWWLFVGTRGGNARLRICTLLREKPLNANQLSNSLNLNYRTVKHHLETLTKNGFVAEIGTGYGKAYTLTEEFDRISGYLEEELGGKLK
jgi:DNA-binding transcriptional ArsR family regulator